MSGGVITDLPYCSGLATGAAISLGGSAALVAAMPDGLYWSPAVGGIFSDRVTAEFDYPPTAVAFGHDRVDVVGVGSDSRVWHTYKAGPDAWRRWERPATLPMSGQISVTTWTPDRPDRLDLIGRGPANDCWHLFFDKTYPGGWGPRPGGATAPAQWESLGGALNSDPVSVSWGPNRIDVVAVGTDNRLYHRYADGTWKLPRWERISSFTTHGRPSLSASAVGRLDVITLDQSGQVRHAYSSGGRFVGADGEVSWETVTPNPEIPFRGNPVGVPGPGDAFHVLAVGQNLTLYDNVWHGGRWWGWRFVSNGLTQGVGDTISAVATPNGTLTVVMEGRGLLTGKLIYESI